MRKGFGGKSATLLAVALCAAPSVAMAEGLEFAGAGARGTMRGGAYVVGADDAMSLLYNPANLAHARGMQLHASLGLLFYNSCYDRDGTYGSSTSGINRGGYFDGSDQYGPGGALTTNAETGLSDGAGGTLSFDDARNFATPEVCNSHRVNIIPELAYSWRIHDRVGIGLGVIAPTAPGNLEFGSRIGGREGMVRGENGIVLPSPARYMLVSQHALLAWPTIGVGVEVAPKVRVGGSFGWGFGTIGFNTVATPYYTENFALGIYSEVEVSDAFVPRVAAGVSGGPWEGFSFAATFTYYGDLDASGTLRAQSLYNLDPADITANGYINRANVPVGIQTQLPWQAQLGARYASIRENVTLAEDAIGDSLDTERWNVEVNVGFAKSSRLREFDVRLSEVPLPDGYDLGLPPTDPANLALYPCTTGITGDPTPGDGRVQPCLNLDPSLQVAVPLRFPAPVRHNWKDQIFFRVGGDYNVVPGRLSVSAGLSYDSNGQQRGYEQLDFQPYRRIGTHMGFTVRINRWDINVAYAHHFNQTRNVRYTTACPGNPGAGTQGEANDANMDGDLLDPGEQAFCTAPEIGSDTPLTTDDDWGLHPLAPTGQYNSDVANSGRFRSRLDVLQVGATYHFR